MYILGAAIEKACLSRFSLDPVSRFEWIDLAITSLLSHEPVASELARDQCQSAAVTPPVKQSFSFLSHVSTLIDFSNSWGQHCWRLLTSPSIIAAVDQPLLIVPPPRNMYSSHQLFPLDFIQKHMVHIHRLLIHNNVNKVDDNMSNSRFSSLKSLRPAHSW